MSVFFVILTYTFLFLSVFTFTFPFTSTFTSICLCLCASSPIRLFLLSTYLCHQINYWMRGSLFQNVLFLLEACYSCCELILIKFCSASVFMSVWPDCLFLTIPTLSSNPIFIKVVLRFREVSSWWLILYPTTIQHWNSLHFALIAIIICF